VKTRSKNRHTSQSIRRKDKANLRIETHTPQQRNTQKKKKQTNKKLEGYQSSKQRGYLSESQERKNNKQTKRKQRKNYKQTKETNSNTQTKKKQTTMTTISTEQQAFRDKLMSFGCSTTNINRIVNQSISDTMELVLMDCDTLFTDGMMGSGASGIMPGQKMKIKVLWSWCRHKYELGKQSIDVASFNDDARAY